VVIDQFKVCFITPAGEGRQRGWHNQSNGAQSAKKPTIDALQFTDSRQ